MRLCTYSRSGQPHAARLGALVNEQMLDLADLAARSPGTPLPDTMRGLLALGAPGLARVRALIAAALPADGQSLSGVRFLPPVPDAEKFLCVGKNYRTHLEELKRTDLIKEIPEEPQIGRAHV